MNNQDTLRQIKYGKTCILTWLVLTAVGLIFAWGLFSDNLFSPDDDIYSLVVGYLSIGIFLCFGLLYLIMGIRTLIWRKE